MRIAIVGDIHEHWGEEDLSYFASEHFDAILFVGDLPRFSHRNTEAVARSVSKLDTRAIFIPGNHDGPSPVQVLAEAARCGCDLGGWVSAHVSRIDRLQRALGSVELGGFSVHPLDGVDVVACRPHAMDGRHLSFAPYLAARFGVTSIEASSERLRGCVDRCTQPIVFLSHNGPAGLGCTRDDLYGRSTPEFDNGDLDLTEAVAHAQRTGHEVLAVVSGHMHHSGDGGMRRWTIEKGGVRYVNAARVPRVFEREGRRHRHCVELVVAQGPVRIREILF